MRLEVSQPVLTLPTWPSLRDIETPHQRQVQERGHRHHLPLSWGRRRRRPSWPRCARGRGRHQGGANILIISDRAVSATQVAIPALLALSAIHQHLVVAGLRTSAGLVVETGTAREVHHFAVLAGYGAEAVHPTWPWKPWPTMPKTWRRPVRADKAIYNYVKAIGKGLSKIMSKMGVRRT